MRQQTPITVEDLESVPIRYIEVLEVSGQCAMALVYATVDESQRMLDYLWNHSFMFEGRIDQEGIFWLQISFGLSEAALDFCSGCTLQDRPEYEKICHYQVSVVITAYEQDEQIYLQDRGIYLDAQPLN